MPNAASVAVKHWTTERSKVITMNKTLAELLDEIAETALARQAKVEHEPIEPESINIGDLLPVQQRSKPWLEQEQ
jgi:hypothetical protein